MDPSRYSLSVVFASVLALATISCQKSDVQAAREPANNPDRAAGKSLSMDDRNFLIKAEKAEVRQRTLARTALQKTRNNDVRQYAQKVFDERSGSLDELKGLMTKNGLAQPFSLSDVELEAKTRFDRTSEDAFDHEFISLMSAELQEVVADFQTAAQTAENPDIRNYAGGVLTFLRKDLDAAMDLEKKLKPSTFE
jgi:putative membrane protein